MDYQPTFYLVSDLVRALGRHITFFDLEATTFRGRPNFGITEAACFMVTPEGPGVVYESLINPEKTISPDASRLTGITQEMVASKENWGVRYAPWFHRLSTTQYVAGFNSNSFDVPAVIEQNQRYGFPTEKFEYTFDVRELHLRLSGAKSRKGTLSEVAEIYGVKPHGDTHRALADVILTLEITHRIIEVYGLDAVVAEILPKAEGSGPKLTAENVAKFIKKAKAYSIPDIAKAFSCEEKAISFEVGKALDERFLTPDLVADASVQDWLQDSLMEASTDILNQGKLKPILEEVSRTAPSGAKLDYIQLRVALMNANIQWASLKPL